jgi:Uma2 family endonuclease
MTRAAPTLAGTRRRFKVGTTGWTAADLDDPRIEAEWFKGHYEIVEGVLTRMPAAYFDGGVALQRLIFVLRDTLTRSDSDAMIATEVDLVIGPMRVPTVDAVYLSPQARAAQKAAHSKSPRKRPNIRYGRIVVPPTLVIESISFGHEAHDRVTKRRWYAEAKIPNYWLLNAQERTLECLVLDGADYRVDAAGRDADDLRPSAFAGLIIPLAKLWAE